MITTEKKNRLRPANTAAETAPRENELNPCRLSVIISFHADPKAPYLLPRLDDMCRHFPARDDIEFIVVDSGSAAKYGKQIREICRRHNVRHLYHHDNGEEVFSPGNARNFGAKHAKGSAVSSFDVDLRVADDFWERLLNLMDAIGISKLKRTYFAMPCLYLTTNGSEQFADADPKTRFLDFQMRWLHGRKPKIFGSVSYCSSVAVIDRLHYLSVGGHHPKFRGHGWEDYEFFLRLMNEEGAIPRASNYYKNNYKSGMPWDVFTYSGFTSQLSILGRAALAANLFVFHLWHHKKTTFYGSAHKNKVALTALIKEFDRTREHPPPLIDAEVKDRVLFVGDEETPVISCLRDVIPLLGETVCANEKEFVDYGDSPEEKLQSFLKKNRINTVLFHNPNANPARHKLYEWCRKKKIKTPCLGKGLLPDSWFFDDNGYGADSKSYAEANWNKPLSAKEKKQIADYIKNTLPKPVLKEVKNLCGEVIGRSVSAEILHRFIHFLRHKFYSFAETRKKKTKNKTKGTLPRLDFYEIRLPSKPDYVYSALSRPPIPFTAPMFERFRLGGNGKWGIATVLKNISLKWLKWLAMAYLPEPVVKWIQKLRHPVPVSRGHHKVVTSIFPPT